MTTRFTEADLQTLLKKRKTVLVFEDDPPLELKAPRKKPKIPKPMNKWQALLCEQLSASKIRHVTEHRFHPVRKWRFDVLVNDDIAVEIDGLLKQGGGRHQTFKGQGADMVKGNEALIAGYKVLHVTTKMVKNGEALRFIERLIFVGRNHGH